MIKTMLVIMGIVLGIALFISKDSVFLVPGVLCYGFIGLIEAIEKIGKKGA